MLQVTERAADVFKDILSEGDGEAIRLGHEMLDGRPAGIEIVAISSPGETDIQTQAPGVSVYVTPGLADELDHMVLDAEPKDDGAEFFVRPQRD